MGGCQGYFEGIKTVMIRPNLGGGVVFIAESERNVSLLITGGVGTG